MAKEENFQCDCLKSNQKKIGLSVKDVYNFKLRLKYIVLFYLTLHQL